MKKYFCPFIFLLFACFTAGSQTNLSAPLVNTAAIVTLKNGQIVGHGFITGKFQVLTTINTVGNLKNVLLETSDGKSFNIMGYTALNNEDDLVLLQSDYNNELKVSLSVNPVMAGQTVYLADTSAKGIQLVKAKVKEWKDLGDVQLIQIETPSEYPLSGMPVFDSTGWVVGMSVVSPVKTEGVCYAVPASKLIKLLASSGTLYGMEMLQPAFDQIKKRTMSDKDKSKAVKEFLDQGVIKMDHKDYNGAVEKFSIAIRISPLDPDAYVFRGQARCMLLQFKDALEDFNKAIDLQPDFAEAYDLRGICKAELGDKTGACEDWKKSFELGYNPAFKLLDKFCEIEKMKD